MKKIIFLLVLFLSLRLAPTVFANEELSLCPQNTEEFNFNILCRLQPENALPGLLTFIIIAAVVISLIFLIWGGIKWITSGGDKANVETARNHIVAAIVGLIVVFLAWFIINFILQTFFGGGLGGGITLPNIINGTTTNPETEPTATPTPTAIPEPTETADPMQDDESEEVSPIPPCPTAYPPDFICQMSEENFE